MLETIDADTLAAATTPSAVVECDASMLRIPTRLEWVDRTAHFLHRRAQHCGACDSSRGDQLLIVLHEALTNAIVHGNLGISSTLREQPGDAFVRALAERSADPELANRDVRIKFQFDGERCEIRVRDEGDGFDWQKHFEKLDAADPDAPPSLANSGRGIIIMRAFTDGVRYEHGGREVVLTLRVANRAHQRAEERLNYARPVRVTPIGADGVVDPRQTWDALTRDVSAGGVALIQTKGHTATRVLIELRDGDQPVYVAADVCRVTPMDEQLFQIGCRFTAVDAPRPEVPSTDPAVLRLIEHVEQRSTQHPRRAHLRVSYTCPIEVRPTGDETYRTAFSRDLSRGGIAFITSFVLPQGPLDLRLPSTGGDTTPIRARVLRCQKVTAGVYDVGCQFV
jgi:anti-sigma regulatory factor (Ser/Thr protein kinase)